MSESNTVTAFRTLRRLHWQTDKVQILTVTIFVFVVVSALPWRARSVYTVEAESSGGGSLTIIKALVAMAALGLALLVVSRSRLRTVGLGPALIMVVAIVLSLCGAYDAGTLSASIVQSFRILMIAATVVLMFVISRRNEDVLVCLLIALGLVALVAAVTGLANYSPGGRLGGGIPQIHPNELAGIAVPPFIGLIVLILRRGVRLLPLLSVGVFGGVIILTGSRTSLLAMAIAVAVALVVNGPWRGSVTTLFLLLLPIVYVILVSGVLDQLASRGGTTGTSDSLESRMNAWKVVLGWDPMSWARWLGKGLSVKIVEVDSGWVPVQPLDSSLVSLLAQVGIVGAVLVLGIVLWMLITSLVRGDVRGLVFPLLIFVVIRSVTENGLLDAAPMFALFLTMATVLSARSRERAASV